MYFPLFLHRDIIIPVGPVPILITNRPSVSAFVEAALNAEAKALIPLSAGYDYEIKFEVKNNKAQPVKSSFIRRPPPEEDPVFEARVSFEADVGIALEWELLFFRLIQATLAVDLGLNLETEVSTNLDAIMVTQPYFYILDRFNVDFFIRLRAALGLNDDIGDSIKDIAGGDDKDKCDFRVIPYEIPSFDADEQSAEDIFVETVTKAQADGKTDDEITLGDFLETAGHGKSYSGNRPALKGPQKSFSLNLEIFREDFTLIGIPEISVEADGEAQFCTNDNALVLPLKSVVKKKGFVLKDIIDGEWFADLNGDIFDQDTDTPWETPTNMGSRNILLELPRASVKGDDQFQIDEDAAVFYRATPELVPFLNNALSAKELLTDLFPEVAPFDCCVNADCNRFGEAKAGFEFICTASKECVEVAEGTDGGVESETPGTFPQSEPSQKEEEDTPDQDGPLTVFVTEGRYNGAAIDGLSGADEKCQAEADLAGLPGTYVAWLSDSKNDAVSRLDNPNGRPYELVTNRQIAENIADLTDGDVPELINVHANGKSLTKNMRVFTGSTPNGRRAGPYCNDWHSAEGNGRLGEVLSRHHPKFWTNRGPSSCKTSWVLYCFEQDGGAKDAPAEVEPSFSQVKSKKSDKCVDVFRAKMNSGAPLIQFRCGPQANQKWSLEEVGTDSFFIKAQVRPKLSQDYSARS